MASADSSHFVVTTIWRSRERPPRVSTLSFFPCRFLIYPTSFRIGIGLRVPKHTHPLAWPHMRFLFVTSGICRRLPSPCSSRSTSCLKLGLGPISPTTGLAPARTAHMSRALKKKGVVQLNHPFFDIPNSSFRGYQQSFVPNLALKSYHPLQP